MLMKKFKVATLGCRTNQYESQGYADQLRRMGYAKAEEGEEADLCIVNTCTVTEGADSSSRHAIRALLRENPKARIAVTGCMAESAPQEILALDERVTVVPNAQKEQLVEHVFPEERVFPEFNIQSFDAHTRAFVKVQDGCNSFCTYCIIPYVRGRSRSRSIGEIVREIEGLVASGYKEVVLTGINVGDFDGGGRLVDLVRAADQVKGLMRLRVSSIDPDEVDAELADAILRGRVTCPSMHIVLQAGSNVTLKRMNRKYSRQQFFDTIDRLQAGSADFTFTTDIIVGFPGESERDFQETLEVVEKVQFAKVHVFPFSPRQRTRAALYPNRLPAALMQSRKQQLLRLSEKAAFALRSRFVGRQMAILFENEEKEGEISGHTSNFLRVTVPKGSVRPNDLVRVNVMENTPEGLKGIVL
ncbi:MAG: tRNA (N(6)-L-threonylcarbamoyladenosine(37)-C(2))-methylthiotransferase MtaB [Chlamydiia bacterium]|nr:tRNA (N(6)-L-threonylcarbamoyladenosine(37)-C(2))-methylthiotransferase MtaB [Chlamydiia bacterium]